MTIRAAIPLILFLIILVACACRTNRPTPPPQRIATVQPDYESEQIAVVSAVAREMYVDDWQLLVIHNADPCPTPEPKETLNPKVLEMRQRMEADAFQAMPELARETIDDFHVREKECHPLFKKLDVPIKYVLAGSKDLDPLFPKGDFDMMWRRFYKKYPDSSGIITFSNPGFNRDYTQAVLATGRGCGGLWRGLLCSAHKRRWRMEDKNQNPNVGVVKCSA